MKPNRSPATLGAVCLVVIVVTLLLAPGAWAGSKYRMLYKFTGGADGSQPTAGVILDGAGNLYGTTYYGGKIGGNWCGTNGCGVVYKLDRKGKETVLYTFTYVEGSALPYAGLIRDSAGTLYGTTKEGGSSYGSVFKLDKAGKFTLLYQFCSLSNCVDGWWPIGGLLRDSAGNLYGTTYYGGDNDWGVVFKLDPTAAETVLYSFSQEDGGGGYPYAGVLRDAAGNFYGTTAVFGGVFELDTSGTVTWLYGFSGFPAPTRFYAGVIRDAAGNVYGTSYEGGDMNCAQYGCGMVFELSPNGDGTWTETPLHSFTGQADGAYPTAGLIFDKKGNLYGTTQLGGASGYGVVFELTPSKNGQWTEKVLHAFNDHPGGEPVAGLVFDQAGHLYGTTQGDGTTTFGSVFKITP